MLLVRSSREGGLKFCAEGVTGNFQDCGEIRLHTLNGVDDRSQNRKSWATIYIEFPDRQ